MCRCNWNWVSLLCLCSSSCVCVVLWWIDSIYLLGWRWWEWLSICCFCSVMLIQWFRLMCLCRWFCASLCLGALITWKCSVWRSRQYRVWCGCRIVLMVLSICDWCCVIDILLEGLVQSCCVLFFVERWCWLWKRCCHCRCVVRVCWVIYILVCDHVCIGRWFVCW